MNITLMAYLIISLGAIAVWHFAYDAILLPSFRQDIRFKLYQLRDRLREVKSENPSQLPNDAFHLVDDSLSWQIDNQHRLTFSLLARTEECIKANPEFAEKIKKRVETINASQIYDYQQIRIQQVRLLKRALLYNAFGWAIYLIPIGLVLAMMERIVRTVKVWGSMSEGELDKMSPCGA